MPSYIGLDAHSATCTAVVVDEKGEIKHRETFPTTESNLIGFMNGVEGEKHLTFEECHLSQWLYVTLVEHVDRLVVCNPVYLAKKPGAKTDFRDALHLAQELRTGHLKPVYHDESRWIELRTLVSSYLALSMRLSGPNRD
ncbi:MAG: transposase [Oligoflexia bacterium]|nr:transposase [Oligoflexia bacterium]